MPQRGRKLLMILKFTYFVFAAIRKGFSVIFDKLLLIFADDCYDFSRGCSKTP